MNGSHFIKIYDWMIQDLHLKGNDLIVYAIIYNWNITYHKAFDKSRSYLATATDSHSVSVQRSLDRLVDDKLLKKEVINGRKKAYKFEVKSCMNL